ncbi:MAG: hypothetical protein ACYDA9_20375 [Terriglobia bacterium]
MMRAVKKRDWHPSEQEVRLQELARREAARQARRIPWPRLLEARTAFVDWEVFTFWVRSIIETESAAPRWFAKIIEHRCPGFLTREKLHKKKHPEEGSPLGLRLSEWIRDHIFADARREGWFDAITFYAFRDPRFNRAWTYWEQYKNEWKRSRPLRYPSFEEWAGAAGDCEDRSRTGREMLHATEAARLAGVDVVAETVSRFMDWEAFIHWIRSPIEADVKLPPVIVRKMRRSYSGLWERYKQLRDPNFEGRSLWGQLTKWGETRFFHEAKAGGWFDVITFEARRHPRSVRTVEYWIDWDKQWSRTRPASYPSLAAWRKAVDNYVVTDEEARE